MKELSRETSKRLVRFQRDEVTSAVIYENIAKREKNEANSKLLLEFAEDERQHAAFWEMYTGISVTPNRLKILWFSLMSRILGYTFVIKLIEKMEDLSIQDYAKISKEIPEVQAVMEDEQKHEDALINMLDEERLQYVGAMVLGLNDALVELTGTIAGLTFAFTHTRLVALSGIITGISATLSMAASNYLAEHADGNPNALKSSIYTGVAYLVTVVLMVLPYLILPNHLYRTAFVIMMITVVLIIFFFNWYISVARSQPFFKNFATMAIISLSVALISFLIGIGAKSLLGIDL